MSKTENRECPDSPVSRLLQFVDWTIENGLCSSMLDFERTCGLSSRYLINAGQTPKLDFRVEKIGRIARQFPQLNLRWLCTGEGSMIKSESQRSDGYREAYEAAMLQIEALNKIIRQKD